MFILSIRYTASLDEVERHRDAHLAWLRHNHAAGHFIGWGRKTPLTGGIILAQGNNADMMQALAQTDPFITHGVASVDVIEWSPSFLAEGIVLEQ